MSAIVVRNLSKSFRQGFWLQTQPVLQGITFEVPAGQMTGFIGRNGAGKSTCIKCVLRLLQPDSGETEVLGEKDWTPKVASQLGYLPEHPQFQPFLSAYEFLALHLRLSGSKVQSSLISETLSRVGLEGCENRRIGQFSKGMKQRVGLAQAIIHKPKLIILDEPLSGLDPEGRRAFKQIIRSINADGVAVFMSSHLLFDLQELCQSLVVIDHGKMVYQGGVSALLQTQDRFHVQFLQSGQVVEQSVDRQDLQKEIDAIRNSGGEIMLIEREKKSLEDAVHHLREEYHRDQSS